MPRPLRIEYAGARYDVMRGRSTRSDFSLFLCDLTFPLTSKRILSNYSPQSDLNPGLGKKAHSLGSSSPLSDCRRRATNREKKEYSKKWSPYGPWGTKQSTIKHEKIFCFDL
jgi:hypothetical protein